MRKMRNGWGDARVSLLCLEQTVTFTAVMCGGGWRRNVRNCGTLSLFESQCTRAHNLSKAGSLIAENAAMRMKVCSRVECKCASETVSRLCRAMQAPTTVDMKKAVRCLRYLKGTSTMGIQYTASFGLIGYVDSNW